MNEKYNGWTNYETWLVKLWIDNDQGSYNYWREEAEDCNKVVLTLADRLKDHFENEALDIVGENGFFVDLINSALCNVNWYEIANSICEEER